MGRASLALLLAAGAVLTTAQAPCDPGYTFYPDLELTEEAGQSVDVYSGSCLRLFRQNAAPFPRPTATKRFATAARDFCAYMAWGGRLLSFSSLSRSPHALLATLSTLVASSPAAPSLVLVGGIQNPNAKGAGFPRGSNWVWSDAGTDPTVINAGFNWAPGQPDDQGIGFTGRVPPVDLGVANFLALNTTSFQFLDVKETDVMDIVCQYRAPAPCPRGFRLHVSDPVNSATDEFGLASCVGVFEAATLAAAADTCSRFGPDANPSIPNNAALRYKHLGTYHGVTGGGYTPLTSFVKSLAGVRGVSGPQFWTGGLLQRNLTTGRLFNAWVDGRVFDSVVHNNSVPVSDSTKILLRLGPSTASLEYAVVAEDGMLPFVCEVDVAVRIASASSTLGAGKVVSYSSSSASPNGSFVCSTGYTLTTGRVSCRQAGYDGGMALSPQSVDSPANTARHVELGRCSGSESFVEDCPLPPGPQSACSDPRIPEVECHLDNIVPAQFPYPPTVVVASGDLSASSSSGGGSSSSSTQTSALAAIGSVLGVAVLALLAVHTTNYVRSMRHRRRDSTVVAPSPLAPRPGPSPRAPPRPRPSALASSGSSSSGSPHGPHAGVARSPSSAFRSLVPGDVALTVVPMTGGAPPVGGGRVPMAHPSHERHGTVEW